MFNKGTTLSRVKIMTDEQAKSLHERMANSKAGKRSRAVYNSYKNRNIHSVKFPDDLEEDFQAWRKWHDLNDNAALKQLIETHPDLKKKPEQ